MITPHDLRDIAAYWGATCDYSYSGEFGTLEHCNRPVHEFIGAVLGHGIETVGDSFTVKVRLRKVESLTESEILGLIYHVEPGTKGVEFYSNLMNKYNAHEFERISENGYSLDERITSDGLWGIEGDGIGSHDEYYDPAKTITYLQSISVYVPGTIREELVLLF